MRLRYAPRAVGDLVAIADYLIERNPAAARAVDTKIRATAELLADFPWAGRALIQRPSVRIMPVVRYPYLVFYTIEEDQVVVLHIRHGAREPIAPDEF